MVTEAAIRRAFRRFEAGERPPNYGAPKAWYVLDDRTGRLFPLKAIWGLAAGVSNTSFKTDDARRLLPRVGKGFKIIQDVAESSSGEFQDRVRESKKDSTAERLKRLEKAPRKPGFYYQAVRVYQRNADVVAEMLSRANGVCGSCGSNAPFIRVSDGSPYLEVHHIQPLADGGEDTVDNAIALCPNCHRKAHYGCAP